MNLKKYALVFAATLGLLLPVQAMAFDLFSQCTSSKTADGKVYKVCGPCKDHPDAPTCQNVSAQKTNPVIDIINSAANIIAVITGVIGILMIILGGFTMVTSGGNTEAVTNSRRRITYALVGMVIVALSWTIIRFITDKIVQ